MPKGYWIARVDVHDAEGYKAYPPALAEPVRRHGGRFLVRGGVFEAVEGTARGRNVVIEFPTYQQAVDCYHSSDYQRAIALRTPHSTVDLIIIEGYDET